MLCSTEHKISTIYKHMNVQNLLKEFKCLNHYSQLFIMLINVKMPTIDLLSSVENEKLNILGAQLRVS